MKSPTYTITSGSLPSGFILNERTGVISGVSTATYQSGGVASTFTVTASDGINSTPRTFNITRKWFDGSTAALAAPNANYIRDITRTTTNGNYWIQPPGQTAYQIYCDMSNQGGGWMCVGIGRQGRQDNTGVGSWWRDAGDRDSLFATSLLQANLSGVSNYTPRYLPALWIRGATQTGNWNEMQMVVNRIELGDSWWFRGTESIQPFTWNQFNPGGGTDSGSSTFFNLYVTRYTGQWLTGSLSGNYFGNSWLDYSATGNDASRNFTWTWSGHGAWNGWSAGSTVSSPGFTNGGEGHALQMVNIFVR